jgi:ABC-type bacteriocin/lantibiotic exporter with double-glycine peptidase domain
MLFPLIGIAIFSGLIGLLWLSLALIVQFVIDKIMLQGSFSALIWFGTVTGLILIVVGGLELALAILITNVTSSGILSLTLKTSIELPRVFLYLALMAYYNLKSTGLACLLTALMCIAFFVFLQQTNREATALNTAIQSTLQGIFPIFSRIMLGFTALPAFLYGSTLVIQLELTIGQLIAFSIINILFIISSLNIVSAAA